MRFDRRKDIHPKYLLLTFTIIGIVLIVLSYAAAPKVAGIRRFTSKLITPIQKGINEIGLWTDSKMKNLNEIKTLTDENEALQAELASCKQEITNYQNKMLELQELRDLYDLDESYPDYEMTAAHVFAKDSTSWFSTFYIDKGTKQGLFKGANVLCGDGVAGHHGLTCLLHEKPFDGVAGIITECFDDYAKVRAVIDDNSNISAKVMPANALCTVEGDLNLYDSGYLLVENIDKDANVSIGDKVVTSPISDLYHSGLIIGYVAKTSYDTNNLTMTAYITPAVDFSNITDVLVITAEKKTVSHE